MGRPSPPPPPLSCLTRPPDPTRPTQPDLTGPTRAAPGSQSDRTGPERGQDQTGIGPGPDRDVVGQLLLDRGSGAEQGTASETSESDDIINRLPLARAGAPVGCTAAGTATSAGDLSSRATAFQTQHKCRLCCPFIELKVRLVSKSLLHMLWLRYCFTGVGYSLHMRDIGIRMSSAGDGMGL